MGLKSTVHDLEEMLFREINTELPKKNEHKYFQNNSRYRVTSLTVKVAIGVNSTTMLSRRKQKKTHRRMKPQRLSRVAPGYLD